MLHRLFTLLSGLSLLLCVAVVVLWVRSHSGAEAADLSWVRSGAGGSLRSVVLRRCEYFGSGGRAMVTYHSEKWVAPT